MQKRYVKNIEKQLKPDKLDESQPGNLFVIVDEDGQRWINGERVTKEQAKAYLDLANPNNEPFEYVGVENE